MGETGSGKSTQLVQYIAEEIDLQGLKIVSTQTRIIAARALAKRVCEEKLQKLGEEVGLLTGTSEKISK